MRVLVTGGVRSGKSRHAESLLDGVAATYVAPGPVHDDADWLEYEDLSDGSYRAVHVVDDRIDMCLFMSARPDLPSRSWLAGLFAKDKLEEADRVGLLVGQPIEKGADTGPTVCSCFGVGRNTICDAIKKQGLEEVSQVTACLKAGGNCGSCVPELKKLLVEIKLQKVAEAREGEAVS